VHDLGINVATNTFVTAVRDLQPVILALSALLTTIMPEFEKKIIYGRGTFVLNVQYFSLKCWYISPQVKISFNSKTCDMSAGSH